MEIKKVKKSKIQRKKRKANEDDDGTPRKHVNKNKKPFGNKHFRTKKNFFEKVKIPQELINKYTRGERSDLTGVKTPYFQEKFKRKEKKQEHVIEHAARAEILLTESQG